MEIPKSRFAAMLILLVISAAARAEFADFKAGFFLDLPEGFSQMNGDGASMVGFAGPVESMSFQVAAYPGTTYASADAMLADVKKRFGADAIAKNYRYQGRNAYFAELSFKLADVPMRGFAFLADGRPGENDYVVVSAIEAKVFAEFKPLLLSALDSFSIDIAALRMPGPVSWKEHPFDEGKPIDATFAYAGGAVRAPVRSNWETASKAVVDREHAVLAAYADSKEYWAEAWKRFYRMIFRDSYSRLDTLAFALGVKMDELWRAGRLPGVAGRVLGPAAGIEAYLDGDVEAEALMGMVQEHTYKRDPKGSDFTAPLTALLRKEGDCDARAMLAAILLQHWNVEAGIAVSRVYSHSVGLAAITGEPGRNAGFDEGGKRFLLMETTARVRPGMLAEEQSVTENWITIFFLF